MPKARLSTPFRLGILLAIYVLSRFGWFDKLGAPTFGWRPSDLAGIAVNYYRGGFHFAYPQVMWGGAGAGHVEMEFPLQPYLTGVLFKLFGLHDWLCVALPLACGFGLVWVVAEFGRYLFGEIAGVAAGASVALSPTFAYVTMTGMWPDPPMVLCGTLGLYLLARWSADGAARHLVLGSAAISLAILLKLTALYLGLPVLFLFVKHYGSGFVKKRTTWLAGAAMLVPAALWYAHAYNLYLEDGNTFGILGGGYLKFPTFASLTEGYAYERALVRVFLYHLTPFGFVAFGYGVYRAFVDKRVFLLVWLGAVTLHTFVAWGGVRYGGHVDYLLPILPVCNLLGGLGFQTFVRKLAERAGTRWQPRLYVPLLGLLVIIVGASTVFAARHLIGRDLAYESWIWEEKRRTGLEVGRVTRPGSLIIVTDHEMDHVDAAHCMTPPDVFYFGDRRGWYISLAWLSVDKIEKLRALGARYLVVSSQSIQRFEAGHAPLRDYLERHFKKVGGQVGIVYDLGAT
jgi:hypothetical protein